jgi:hypothetical protein
MNANELIVRAEGLCRALRRPLPVEVKAYAWDWQRQRYDLAWCWAVVKSALKERRALWQVEVEVRRHHALLQAEQDRKQRDLCKPVLASPTHSTAPQRDCLQLPAALQALDPRDDIEDGLFWPAPQYEPESPAPARQDLVQPPPPPQKHRHRRGPHLELLAPARPQSRSARGQAARQPGERRARRRRPDSRTVQFIDLLRRRLGGGMLVPWSEIAAQARREGLLRPDETVGGCKPLRYAKRALNIRSRRLAFGGPVHWQIAPPKWASQGTDGRQR